MTPRNKARIAFVKCLRATTPWHILNDALDTIRDVQEADTTSDGEVIELENTYCNIRKLERAARARDESIYPNLDRFYPR